jgi:glycosyltransferase involved in cell wall biosynthesis
MSILRQHRPVVLTLLGAYWPGNDASGPNQSFKALATVLRNYFEFRLIARDRPFGASESYEGSGRWIDLGFTKARYCSVGCRGANELAGILRATRHDILWLNGFFDREFTIPALVQRRAGAVPLTPALLSPRGEFAAGALKLKSAKKTAYIAITRRAGLLRGITLHATSEGERTHIEHSMPWTRDIAMAPNVRLLIDPPAPRRPRDENMVRLIFVGRITRIKNLDYALRVLSLVRVSVALDICGPVQDSGYWRECQQLAAGLPQSVTITHKGEIANADVLTALSEADLFFLPTRSENFGHAIFEAFASGLPALISDQTPWQDLERHDAGWSLPLAEPQAFAAAIERFADMTPIERVRLSHGARRLAEAKFKSDDAIQCNREMFRNLLVCANLDRVLW